MHIRVSIDTFVTLYKQKQISMYNPLFSWHLDIPVVIGLLAAECIYILLVRRLWHKAGRYDTRSTWAWSIGVAVIFIALESPLDTIGEERLLSAHMLQHELLLTVAPTLLLLGLFPRLVVPITRSVFKPLLRNRYTYALLRVIFSPYCTLGAWLVCIYTWHLPLFYLLALRSDLIHRVEHFSFITAGLLFWLPIIEPVPGLTKMRPLAKLGYLALGQIGTAPLAAIFLWSPTLLYPYYASKIPLWGISHLSDQQWAGMVMMIVDMLAALTAAGWIALKALAWAEWQDQRPRPLHVSPPSPDR
jgi:cytochrome c oxidase assembly factor CtaG